RHTIDNAIMHPLRPRRPLVFAGAQRASMSGKIHTGFTRIPAVFNQKGHFMVLSPLNALSPLDGRYQSKLDALRPYFSEYALIRYRARVEIAWLSALAQAPALTEIAPFSRATLDQLAAAAQRFGEEEAAQVKAIEARTNHDVKALEY